MSRHWLARFVRGLGALLLLVGLVPAFSGTAFATGGAPSGSGGPSNHKVEICHRTDSDHNPYVMIPVDTDAAGGGKDKGAGDHAAEHQGPVWSPGLKADGVEWGDIIPPYTDDQGTHFDGLNWSAAGQRIYGNGCKPADAVAPIGTLAVGECTADGAAHVTGRLDDNGVEGVRWRLSWSGEHRSVSGTSYDETVLVPTRTTISLQFRVGDTDSWHDVDGASAQAGPCTPPPPPAECTDGLIALGDISFRIDGSLYTSADAVTQAWNRGKLPSPLAHVTAFFDRDDDGAADDVPAGCRRAVQLESFSTDGPTWATSGTQVWLDGDGGVIETGRPSVTLTVDTRCFFQTDLSSQGAQVHYYDGRTAGYPVPHYPDVTTPRGLIAASNGGTACTTPPPAPKLDEQCTADGHAKVVVSLDNPTSGSLVATIKVNDEDVRSVEVPAGASRSVTLGSLRSEDAVTVVYGGTSTSYTVEDDCPAPVEPSGHISGALCTADGFHVSGTFADGRDGTGATVGGRWQLRFGDGSTLGLDSSPYDVRVPASVEAGSSIELGYVADGTFHQVARTEAEVQECALPSGHLTTECGDEAGTVTVASLDDGVFGDADWRLVEGSQDRPTVVVDSPEPGTTVTADEGTVYRLQYSVDHESWVDASTVVAAGRCRTQPPGNPEGDVTKTAVPAGGSTVQPDSSIAYTVKVTNTGRDAIRNEPVVDTLPAHVSVVDGSVSDDGTVSGDAITWKVSLEPGESKTLTYKVHVHKTAPAGADLVNEVRFLERTASTVHTVAAGRLALVKSVSVLGGADAQFGSTLVYRLTATAGGTLDQHDVVISDVLPGYAGDGSGFVTYVAGSAACEGAGRCTATYDDSSHALRWAIGDLAAGASRTVTFKVTIVKPAADDQGGIPAVTIRNKGEVRSTESGPTPSNVVETPVTAVEGVKIIRGGGTPGGGTTGGGTPGGGIPGGGVLAHTGSDLPVSAALLWAAGLMSLGAALLLLGRRLGRGQTQS